jgi:hypothetical protein
VKRKGKILSMVSATRGIVRRAEMTLEQGKNGPGPNAVVHPSR